MADKKEVCADTKNTKTSNTTTTTTSKKIVPVVTSLSTATKQQQQQQKPLQQPKPKVEESDDDDEEYEYEEVDEEEAEDEDEFEDVNEQIEENDDDDDKNVKVAEKKVEKDDDDDEDEENDEDDEDDDEEDEDEQEVEVKVVKVVKQPTVITKKVEIQKKNVEVKQKDEIKKQTTTVTVKVPSKQNGTVIKVTPKPDDKKPPASAASTKSTIELKSKVEERTSPTKGLFRPNQFVAAQAAAFTNNLNNTSTVQMRKNKLVRQSVSFEQPPAPAATNNTTTITKQVSINDNVETIPIVNRRPLSEALPNDMYKRNSDIINVGKKVERFNKIVENNNNNNNSSRYTINKTHNQNGQNFPITHVDRGNNESFNKLAGERRSCTPPGRISDNRSKLEKSMNKYNSKKQKMKRANTIDIPKQYQYVNGTNNGFGAYDDDHDDDYNNGDDADDDDDDDHSLSIGLKGTIQPKNPKPLIKTKMPTFKPKTENDLKFLAFIKKQSTNNGLSWTNPNAKVQPLAAATNCNNWTNKFDNIKNNFEQSAASQNNPIVVQTVTEQQNGARNFWKQNEVKNVVKNIAAPPKPNPILDKYSNFAENDIHSQYQSIQQSKHQQQPPQPQQHQQQQYQSIPPYQYPPQEPQYNPQQHQQSQQHKYQQQQQQAEHYKAQQQQQQQYQSNSQLVEQYKNPGYQAQQHLQHTSNYLPKTQSELKYNPNDSNVVSGALRIKENDNGLPPMLQTQTNPIYAPPSATTKIVVPEPLAINQFSHAPASAFQPLPNSSSSSSTTSTTSSMLKSDKPEHLHFQPIHHQSQQNSDIHTSAYHDLNSPNLQVKLPPSFSQHTSPPARNLTFLSQSSSSKSPTSNVLPWTNKTSSGHRVLNIATSKFENNNQQQQQPPPPHHHHHHPLTQSMRFNDHNINKLTQHYNKSDARIKIKRGSLPNNTSYSYFNEMDAPHLQQTYHNTQQNENVYYNNYNQQHPHQQQQPHQQYYNRDHYQQQLPQMDPSLGYAPSLPNLSNSKNYYNDQQHQQQQQLPYYPNEPLYNQSYNQNQTYNQNQLYNQNQSYNQHQSYSVPQSVSQSPFSPPTVIPHSQNINNGQLPSSTMNRQIQEIPPFQQYSRQTSRTYAPISQKYYPQSPTEIPPQLMKNQINYPPQQQQQPQPLKYQTQISEPSTPPIAIQSQSVQSKKTVTIPKYQSKQHQPHSPNIKPNQQIPLMSLYQQPPQQPILPPQQQHQQPSIDPQPPQIMYTCTDYTEPSSCVSTYIPQVTIKTNNNDDADTHQRINQLRVKMNEEKIDSITNPAAAPLVLTNNCQIISPMKKPELLKVFDYPSSPDCSPLSNSISPLAADDSIITDDDDDDDSFSDLQEYTAAKTHVMKGPVSQTAVTVSHKTKHIGDDGTADDHKGSVAAKNLHNVLKSIKIKTPSEKSQVSSSSTVKSSTTTSTKSATTAVNKMKSIQNKNIISSATNATNIKLTESPKIVNNFKPPTIIETPSSPMPLNKSELPSHIIFNNCQRTTNTAKSNQSIEYLSNGDSILSSKFEIPLQKQIMNNQISNPNAYHHQIDDAGNNSADDDYPKQYISPFPTRSPNPLSKSDSWKQICNKASSSSSGQDHRIDRPIQRTKSGNTLNLPKQFEAGIKKTEISEKQRTVEAYFSGQKSPQSLSRSSSQQNVIDLNKSVCQQSGIMTSMMNSMNVHNNKIASAIQTTTTTTTINNDNNNNNINNTNNRITKKKSSVTRIKTSEKASIGKQLPSSGLSRSHTMPHITSIHLLDESNVDDAFEDLFNSSVA